ncbi:putative NBD/HSP70 family sugar kinase [Paenibacillus phyllosphaerae]|uniref:Putative NBD/HSP70 family sugar kinase n=1 Tax=Paenibacillus phyllosphaerae TaxID=274593 RepID=A0A7W5FNH8_9BACL|nr:ROK family protein [Paenibacillus phyllosphaerae]MBB3111014.1 putative NBD/HSP70 family sugar kinase [Paenibacillus phyllosphaerae]
MTILPSFPIASPKKLIYTHIARQGVTSKAELMPLSGMTSSSLTRLLEEMVADKLLITGYGPSSGGRRPILYEVNADYGYFFGLDISRRTSTLGFFDAKMNSKALLRWRMDEAMTPEALIDYVVLNIRSIMLDHHIQPHQVVGIGIGAVGPLDRKTGVIIEPSNFPARGWNQVPICKLLEERTGIASRLGNGADAALIGEHWSMRSENLQHMLYVHAGVGLRSAMMSGGHIVHGSVDMEGAVGQMIIQMDGPRLHDHGNYGAWEALASVQALEKRARAVAKTGRADIPGAGQVPPERLTYDVLLQGLHSGNAYAREIFTQSAVCFGIGLANLINVLHPESIVLGGPLINSHELYFQTAIDTAKRNIYYYPDYVPSFSKGKLQEDAVAVGSAMMVWSNMVV